MVIRSMAALIVLLWGSFAPAHAENLKQVRFRVPLSELASDVTVNGKTEKVLTRALSDGLAKGKSLTDTLEVSFPGELYNPPLRLKAIGKSAANFSTLLGAAQADFSAYKAEDDPWIIDCFIPEDKPLIENFLRNGSMRLMLLNLVRATDTREISGHIRYKGMDILFVKDVPGGPGFEKLGPVLYTFKETPRGFRRTNDFSTDDIFDVLFPVLRQHKGRVDEVR